MPDAPNLRDNIAKSVLTVAIRYGCGIFRDFIAHLQHLSHSRDDFN